MDSLFTGVTPEAVALMFPHARLANIQKYLPDVLTALRQHGCDRTMLLMALATIRAEIESFVPMEEGISRFNTELTPFDRYEGRRDLGNTEPGDGAKYKGRGFVQLTGRANYAKYTKLLAMDLVNAPDLANDPLIAAFLLALFLVDKQDRIRAALDKDDLATARRLVNGGLNGVERFSDAYRVGERVLPA